MTSSLLRRGLLSITVLAGCGGEIIAPGDTGGSASGAGGGASSSATTVTASSGTGGSGKCAGKAGIPCPDGEFCHFENGLCGGFDDLGVCVPKPLGCTNDECPGACGCDDVYYCSECEANLAGVDVKANGTCAPPQPDQYSASLWIG